MIYIRFFVIICLFCLTESILFGQTLKGEVLNNKSEIMPFVKVKDTVFNTYTLSDQNGQFAIPIQNGSVLVFSYVGYKSVEISVAGKSKIDLILEIESTQIDEIVVVAYGVQKRAHLTGSVATLSSRELSQKPVDNLTTMLSGRLPGVIARQQSGVPGENSAK